MPDIPYTPSGTSTASHPRPGAPDPTITNVTNASLSQTSSSAVPSSASNPSHASEGGQPTSAAAPSPELARLKVRLIKALRHFPDFPQKGVLFEDILPIFADPVLHEDLLRALELFVREQFAGKKIDALVGLDARGFLFGPSLALRLGVGFAPVRKKGKLPGGTVTATYQKEYGADEFAMQEDAVREGGNVVIVDDIIATGGSAAAAGELVKKLGANVLGYVFLDELEILKGREKLGDAPVHTLLLRPMDLTKMEQEARERLEKLGRPNKQSIEEGSVDRQGTSS